MRSCRTLNDRRVSFARGTHARALTTAFPAGPGHLRGDRRARLRLRRQAAGTGLGGDHQPRYRNRARPCPLPNAHTAARVDRMVTVCQPPEMRQPVGLGRGLSTHIVLHSRRRIRIGCISAPGHRASQTLCFVSNSTIVFCHGQNTIKEGQMCVFRIGVIQKI